MPRVREGQISYREAMTVPWVMAFRTLRQVKQTSAASSFSVRQEGQIISRR